jgi:hypothetical protein
MGTKRRKTLERKYSTHLADKFANVMEQEDAQAALAKGLQLEKGDLDKLITEF